MGTQRGEKVVGLLELETSLFGRVLGDGRPEIGVGVEAGSDGGATDGLFTGARIGVADTVKGKIDLGDPAADDLAEADRRCVL